MNQDQALSQLLAEQQETNRLLREIDKQLGHSHRQQVEIAVLLAKAAGMTKTQAQQVIAQWKL